MRHAIAYAVMTAMLVLPLPSRAEDVKPATFDPLSIFAPAMLDRLQRDHRCDDVRPLAEAVVKTDGDDTKADVAAMRAFEHCASLSRLGDWDAYVDYAVLGAATAAFLLGRASGDTRAFDRSLATAKQVHGFDAEIASGKTYGTGTLRVGSSNTDDGNQSANVQTSGRVIYKSVTKESSSTGNRSELGMLATQIGAMDRAELAKK